MRTLPTIFACCLLTLTFTNSLGQRKSIAGTFYSAGYYSGLKLVFKSDLTFTLKYRGHISSDTAAGTFKLQGDTIFLNYDYNNYETIISSYREQNKEVPVDIQLAAGRALRPKMLVKKRSKLYVIDEITSQLKKNDRNGKTQFFYLNRAK